MNAQSSVLISHETCFLESHNEEARKVLECRAYFHLAYASTLPANTDSDTISIPFIKV